MWDTNRAPRRVGVRTAGAFSRQHPVVRMAFERSRFMAALAGAALAAALAGGGAAAAERESAAFRVAGVTVEASAATAAEARVRALAAAHVRAFAKLISRIVPPARIRRVPRLDHPRIAPMVASFEVEEERAFANRYRARLAFRFNREAVRRFLRRARVPFAETAGPRTLVLPVLRKAGALLLWDEPNPWRRAWSEVATDGLVPLAIPRGGLADMREVGAAQAVSGAAGRLEAIAVRYRAGAVIVAVAAPGGGAGGGLRVTWRRHPPDGGGAGTLETRSARGFAAAAHATAARIQSAWRRRHLLRFDRERGLRAVVPLAGVGQWVAVSRKLAGIPSIESSRVLSLTRREAALAIRYYGARDELAGALARSGLRLAAEGGRWTIRPSGAGPAGGARR